MINSLSPLGMWDRCNIQNIGLVVS